MTVIKPKRKKKNQSGGTYAALAILAVIVLAVSGYLFFSPHMKTPKQQPRPTPTKPSRIPDVHTQSSSQTKLPLPDTLRPPEEPPDISPDQTPRPISTPDYKVEKKKPLTSVTGKARLAIIIDDMGASMKDARALSDIGVPLTFSIIPGLRNYRGVASFAAANGIETMIHIPMQFKEWPQKNLESNGLLIAMDGTTIKGRVEQFTRNIPGAVGANNHMGSEFTEHDEQMTYALEVLRGKGLFFIDSATSPKSVGFRLAKEMGIKTAKRNVFLDNEQNRTYIMGQLDEAVALAIKNGYAVAICHPHPATIKTLAVALPTLKSKGITLVYASSVVK